jgi:hypothetical protein
VVRRWGAALCGVFLVGLLGVALSGCDNAFESVSDDSTYEARVEAAYQALDKGDYDKAKQLLDELVSERPDDAQLQALRSNACAGLVGIDTFHLLEVIDDLDKEDKKGDIDMVGKVIGDENGVLTRAAVDAKLKILEDCAFPALERIANPGDEHLIQLGLLSVYHAAMVLAQVVMDDLGLGAITLTEQGLNDLYPAAAALDARSATTERLNKISQDLLRVSKSVDAIVRLLGTRIEDNDLAKSFDEFKAKLDQNRDGVVTAGELETYINSL